MELRQLEYFVAVAEELHFGHAAARLHIGQPAVSQQIRRLERELGVELLDRNPRTVTLTGAGRRFLPRARDVLAAVAEARAAVEEYVADRHAVLRLGTSTGLEDHLDRLLDVLAAAEPELGVELVSASTSERLDGVAKGELDAAFIRNPDGWPGELRMIPVWHDPLVAVLPAGHPVADAPEVALADLAALPLRLTPRLNNRGLVDLVLSACHAAGFEPVAGPVYESMQDALAAIGHGTPTWTVIYAASARRLNYDRVVFRPFRAPGLVAETALAVPADGHSPRVTALLRALGR